MPAIVILMVAAMWKALGAHICMATLKGPPGCIALPTSMPLIVLGLAAALLLAGAWRFYLDFFRGDLQRDILERRRE